MPTFSAIELDHLVEPRFRNSYKKPLSGRITNLPTTRAVQGNETAVTVPPLPPRHIYISPALYVTPEPAPIPETATDPLSPSPYVVNHKRRGGGGRGAVGSRRSNSDEFEVQSEEQEKEKADLIELTKEGEESAEVVEDNFFDDGGDNELFVDKKTEEEEDGFLDPRCDSVCLGSEDEGTRQLDCRSFVSSTHGEFFDAIEDFSSDSAASNMSSYAPNFESEMRALRLSLLEEIERRKDAEDALNSMHCQWQRIADLLSDIGFTLPTVSSSGSIQLEDASIEGFSQELIVARYVAQALGKAQARAEAELAAESILQSKEQEICRLRDRLQYYEAVNHEMSQRNQGIVEVARKQRQRRQTRRRWVWSCIGASVAIGISVLTYSYTNKHPEVPSDSKATSN